MYSISGQYGCSLFPTTQQEEVQHQHQQQQLQSAFQLAAFRVPCRQCHCHLPTICRGHSSRPTEAASAEQSPLESAAAAAVDRQCIVSNWISNIAEREANLSGCEKAASSPSFPLFISFSPVFVNMWQSIGRIGNREMTAGLPFSFSSSSAAFVARSITIDRKQWSVSRHLPACLLSKIKADWRWETFSVRWEATAATATKAAAAGVSFCYFYYVKASGRATAATTTTGHPGFPSFFFLSLSVNITNYLQIKSRHACTGSS